MGAKITKGNINKGGSSSRVVKPIMSNGLVKSPSKHLMLNKPSSNSLLSSPRGVILPTIQSSPSSTKLAKIDKSQSRAEESIPNMTLSGFNPSRMANKRQKILNLNNKSNMGKTESEVLEVLKRSNDHYEDNDLITECLLKHFFMRNLEVDSRRKIIREMSLCMVQAGDVIFQQGTMGNYFYIVKGGDLELFINDTAVTRFRAGDSFGELALLHGAPRSGTVKALTKSYLWCLERKNFRKVVDLVNKTNYEENIKFISSISILANIDSDMKSILASNLIKEFYEKDQYIVKEGDTGSCIFIIKEGEVVCSINDKTIRTLKKGDHFGEKAVLLDVNRTMDVIATVPSVIYSISVDTLKSMVGDNYRDVLCLNFIKMSFIKVFGNQINMRLLENSYSSFKMINYFKGETVLKAGHNISSKIVIIIEGSVVNPKTNAIIAKRGDIMYENDVFQGKDEKLKCDLFADPDCLLVEASTEVFMKHMGGSIKEIIRKSKAIDSLNKVPLFKNFTYSKKELLSSIVFVETYENGKKIITQGETDSRFYIVKSGKVDIFIDSNYIRTLNELEYFGERALFFNEPRTATAKANGKTELYVIEHKDFIQIMEENLSNYLKQRFYLQDNTIELKDLDYIKDLGAGSFGSVCLVKYRKNKHLYAIKAMAKTQIDAEQLHKNLELERGILLKIDHPFIVKLVKTMKDNKFIYFLMEYIKGKELFDVIRDIGLLNKYQTQFYACSLMLAIEYLHERNCVYRDIKPENVMVSETGFIKLIDFGTVKEIVDRTSTIIGTPHYMAPETILGEGYSLIIDYWSIAICMYEFFCGNLPFGESADDPIQVYLSVINDSLKFPGHTKDKDFKSLMTAMLTKNPLIRLCKLSLIKAHPWFAGFSWENLISLDIALPYKLDIPNKEYDSKNLPYTSYVKNMKEYVPSKDNPVDRKNQAEYDRWFKNF